MGGSPNITPEWQEKFGSLVCAAKLLALDFEDTPYFMHPTESTVTFKHSLTLPNGVIS